MTVSLTYLKAFSWGTTRWTSSQEGIVKLRHYSRLGGMRLRSHPAIVAVRHGAAASDRKMRSVDRETRWRWR